MSNNKIITKKDLAKAFKEHATAMVDIKHLYETIKNDLATDVKVGDYVISTTLYDSSVFVVDPLYKEKPRQRTIVENGNRRIERFTEKVEMPNPYEEIVVKRDATEDALTIKANGDEDGSHSEMRIKVKKLSLLSWDESTQSYPRQSIDIIFRQRTINFAEKYVGYKDFYEAVEKSDKDYYTRHKEQIAENLRVINLLMAIPPFLAFYDKKYGVLVKRKLNVVRVVLPYTVIGERECVNKVVEQNVETLVEQAHKKIGDADSLKHAICVEKFKPERVEQAIEKAGGFEQYAPEEKVVVGVGKAM
jgi:hypothetical protein